MSGIQFVVTLVTVAGDVEILFCESRCSLLFSEVLFSTAQSSIEQCSEVQFESVLHYEVHGGAL